ncbi:MAG: anthranilate/aminodeoxychorismate synthase component [Bacilli bacterium]|nr:anthranilate/aminodeoxychorismate synthase component [Bacilli bacterium]
MLVMIDNYDSFTFNLVQYFQVLGQQVHVVRNDQVTLQQLEELGPSHLVVSPGPCTPNEAGISLAAIRHFAGRVPMLGVCLGHQCIGQVFGGVIVKAQRLMHGKVDRVYHNESQLFAGIPESFIATRYHSLAIESASVPAALQVTARTEDGEIMAVEHRDYAIAGVQFHPESILTEYGSQLLANFLLLSEKAVALT